MLKRVVVLSLILGITHGSLFCPHTTEPSGKDNFRSMIIESKSREGQEPMYRIVDSDNRDQSFTTVSEQFRLLTRMDNSECPGRSCVTELSAAMPRHQGSVLYLTNIVGKLIPPGFTPVEVKNRLYCTIVEGDCGATVPVYRHYKFTTAGLFHAYSTDGVDIDGFTRETMPLCWAWPVETVEAAGVKTVKEDDSNLTEEEENKEPQMIRLNCSSKSKKPVRSAMKSLNVWKNNRPGTFMDHYYTTKHPGKGYEYDDTIGLVVVDEEKSKCNCLVRLTQMFDDKPEGLWARLDHKLISDYKEPPPNAGEEYTSMGEEVYCAKEEGACGATIALRKFFKLGDLDTTYTVNDEKTPMFSIPSPSGVLCYIWPTGTTDLPAEALKGVKKSDKEEAEKKETTTEAPKKDETTPAKEGKVSKQEKKPVKEGKKDEKKTEAKKSEEKEKSTTAAPSSTTVEVTQTTTVKREEPSTTTVEVTSTTPSTTTEATTEATTAVEATTEAATTSEAVTESTTTSEAVTESTTTSEAVTESTTTSEATTEAAATSESTTEATTTSEIPSSSAEPTVETTTEASTTLTSEVKVEETTVSSTAEPEKPVDEPRTSEAPKEEEKEQTTTSVPESSSASTELPKETSTAPEATTVVEETTVSKQ